MTQTTDNSNLGKLFTATASCYAAQPALIWNDRKVTYRELAAQVDSITAFLYGLGYIKDTIVAITADKRTTTYALVFACLRLGAPYVMLDPAAPKERQRKILEKCGPDVIVSDSNYAAVLTDIAHGLNADIIMTDDLASNQKKVRQETLNNLANFPGSQPAYIMFTSGSTGFPKGAVMTHDNVMLLISWAREEFGFGPGEVLTNVNPLYFDNSVFDIYASLYTGAALAPFDEVTTRSPGDLLSGLNKRGCTSWFSVPSLLIYLDRMKAIRKDTMPKVRRFIFGGEGYPKASLKRLYDTYSHKAELINVYGPTECTCICSVYRLSANDFEDQVGFPPLGYVTKNFDFLILDENNQEVVPGAAGELCLLGPCVGKGYYNDPEQTQAAFSANHTVSSLREPMYHTGDIVRLDPQSKKVYILGRKDNQIKHMGYRIELEEIENALSTIAGIQQAVAVHGNKHGGSYIIAAVTSMTTLKESDVKQHLKAMLPLYMIPSEIHFQESLARSPNGKLDRQSIAAKIFPNSNKLDH